MHCVISPSFSTLKFWQCYIRVRICLSIFYPVEKDYMSEKAWWLIKAREYMLPSALIIYQQNFSACQKSQQLNIVIAGHVREEIIACRKTSEATIDRKEPKWNILQNFKHSLYINARQPFFIKEIVSRKSKRVWWIEFLIGNLMAMRFVPEDITFSQGFIAIQWNSLSPGENPPHCKKSIEALGL